MSNFLQCVNMAVQLPDKRILLHRDIIPLWSISIERFINKERAPLDCVNDILWNLFGINPTNYSDNFIEVKRFPPTKNLEDNNIVLYVAKIKSSIVFQAKPTDKFSAISWNDLLKDIMRNSIYVEYNRAQKHTQNAIIVAKELHIKEVF